MNYKLRVKNIEKTFKTKNKSLTAIKNISFDVKQGEIVAIVGTSGCGKSTLLNIIDNLDIPTKGEILFDTDNPKISYMLQSDALLPFRTVLDNANLGLELSNELTEENSKLTTALLKDYGLYEFRKNYPDSLSGGMRQRVALIRSLAIKPDILLLDEPFSALDYFTRISIADDVHKILKENDITSIIITHDIAEALSIADRIIVLSNRPSTIKKIYDIDIQGSSLERRTNPEFNKIYECIWRDLDVKI